MSAPFEHDCAEHAVLVAPCAGCGARRYACAVCSEHLDEFTDHLLDPCRGA